MKRMESKTPWMEDYSASSVLWGEIKPTLIKLIVVCAIAVVFGWAMVGCGAHGEARGGSTTMEQSITQPTTETTTYEAFGRDPTPAEIAAMPWLKRKAQSNP